MMKQLVNDHNGVIVREPNYQTMATFMYANDAISCATSIKTVLDAESDKLEYNLAVVLLRKIDDVRQ